MESAFFSEKYTEMIEKLFLRFPSFQKAGASAYKPGIANMEFIDSLMGHPHRNYKVIHIAGTNGKGSVSNMLASVLAASGCKVGLYTSPHIVDFRERMRIVTDEGYGCVSREYVWDFLHQWSETFDHLDLSFFEITTIMALKWFSDEEVDYVVLETGLGGRLDSTNIVTPVLSVITNIGLDHCDMLGETLSEIAFEKAGIIKPRVKVVIGESHPETEAVFERKVLYTNLPEPSFMGDRGRIMSLLVFADRTEPMMWDEHEAILKEMDLQGAYQRYNLRTVLASMENLGIDVSRDVVRQAVVHTARRTGFRGRWEKLSDSPLTICDIGHNEHGLRHNIVQLQEMKASGRCSELIIVYGSVADKDVDSVLHLLPGDAIYIFTQAQSRRALPAETIRDNFISSGKNAKGIHVRDNVRDAVALARVIASENPKGDSLIYIGGSTYVVSEAVTSEA